MTAPRVAGNPPGTWAFAGPANPLIDFRFRNGAGNCGAGCAAARRSEPSQIFAGWDAQTADDTERPRRRAVSRSCPACGGEGSRAEVRRSGEDGRAGRAGGGAAVFATAFGFTPVQWSGPHAPLAASLVEPRRPRSLEPEAPSMARSHADGHAGVALEGKARLLVGPSRDVEPVDGASAQSPTRRRAAPAGARPGGDRGRDPLRGSCKRPRPSTGRR
jgi:hypothetical protein